MTGLLRIARNVRNLSDSTAFYQALGFQTAGATHPNPTLASSLGVTRMYCQFLSLGAQTLELTQCEPAGADYPPAARANDPFFQHIAILTNNITTAAPLALQAGGCAISTSGPQQLPPESGGAIAWKFRDPDGHPLEYLQFPGTQTRPGYDHSAISISNIAQSMLFYANFGFAAASRQVNSGPAQQRLDAVPQPIVDVITLKAAQAPPHLELLHYQTPVAYAQNWALNDIAADRLVLRASNSVPTLRRDPDGHVVWFENS